MQVVLAATGGGTPESMTIEGAEALRQAECIIGAKRLLEQLPQGCTQNRIAAVRPEAIMEEILRRKDERIVVAYSGDTGFYSGARVLLPLLHEKAIPAKILPGVSSVQLLAARLGRPWQDWRLESAHGMECNVVSAVSGRRPVFFLTGGALDPADICRRLTGAGLGGLTVTVGENLSYPDEKITSGTAEELAAEHFAPLSVLLAEPAPGRKCRCHGFPDGAFQRGDVPMTKQEVRAAALAKLAIGPADNLWDVGAGTGSVSVELALAAPEGLTCAVECNNEACELIQVNRERFSAWNLQIISGRAPDVLHCLPEPDGVFIGGTKGGMAEIVDVVLAKNPKARICISAIALETLYEAAAALTKHGLTASVTQIAVSRSKPAGKLHLMMANNPVFLITGNCDA